MVQQILPISIMQQVQQVHYVCSSTMFIFSRLIVSLFFIILVAASCPNIDIRRVFYRFNYSSVDNTISTVEAFVLTQTTGAASFNPRITIEWNDITVNPAINTTIPRMNLFYPII
jgi:hypothetical protein